MRPECLWCLLYVLSSLVGVTLSSKPGSGRGGGRDGDSGAAEAGEGDVTSTSSPPSPPPASAHTSTPTPSSTTSGGSATPSSLPNSTFQWTPPDNTTTCTSTTFLWASHSQLFASLNMSLEVSNINISSHPLPSSGPGVGGTIATNVTNASGVVINLQIYTWMKVNVPEGWYTVRAIPLVPSNSTDDDGDHDSDGDDGVQSLLLSAPFFVKNGSDTSCVVDFSASSSRSSGSQTPSDSEAAQTPAAAASHRTDIPVLVGTILGALVAFVVLSIAFIFPQWYRHALPQPAMKSRRVLYAY
jgi:hypothetical protein